MNSAHIVKMFLDKDAEMKDNCGNTPIITAAMAGQRGIVNLLQEHCSSSDRIIAQRLLNATIVEKELLLDPVVQIWRDAVVLESASTVVFCASTEKLRSFNKISKFSNGSLYYKFG
jgi:hypothetical protein